LGLFFRVKLKRRVKGVMPAPMERGKEIKEKAQASLCLNP
jgi:hypothetical protein